MTDVLDVLIDEDADALSPGREIGRTLADKTAGVRPEDKAHPINAQCFHSADVLGIAHTAYLNY
jgi:hypothetical protein